MTDLEYTLTLQLGDQKLSTTRRIVSDGPRISKPVLEADAQNAAVELVRGIKLPEGKHFSPLPQDQPIDAPIEIPPRFEPKRFLEFVEACRVAGICLPTAEMGRQEASHATYYPKGHGARKRYWAGHSPTAKVHWFTYPNDMGALTYNHRPFIVGNEQPEVTVPLAQDCDVCLDATWHPNRDPIPGQADSNESL